MQKLSIIAILLISGLALSAQNNPTDSITTDTALINIEKPVRDYEDPILPTDSNLVTTSLTETVEHPPNFTVKNGIVYCTDIPDEQKHDMFEVKIFNLSGQALWAVNTTQLKNTTFDTKGETGMLIISVVNMHTKQHFAQKVMAF